MRLISPSAVIAAVMTLLLPAPPYAAADDAVRTTKTLPVRAESIPRRWGIDGLLTKKSNSGPRDRVLPDAVVEHNTLTGKIAVIRPINSRTGIPVAGTSSPQETAEKYLRANHESLGLTPDLSELHLVRTLDMSGSVSFTWEQLYQGVPVISSEVYAVARKNSVLLVSTQLRPITSEHKLLIHSDPAPAVKAVIDDVNRHYPAKADERFPPKARFGVLVREGVPTGVWEVEYTTTDDGYRSIVDAGTNEVLSVMSVMIRD